MKEFSLNKQQALDLIMDESTIIIDVRTAEELDEVPPITEDCYNIPFDKDFLSSIKELEEDGEIEKDTKILLYSENGERSLEALKVLRDAGYTEAYDLDGGISAVFEDDC